MTTVITKDTLGKQDEVAFKIGTGCLINRCPSAMLRRNVNLFKYKHASLLAHDKAYYCLADILVMKIVCPLLELYVIDYLKALANEDTLLPTQMFPRLLARAKNVSDFVQKHFVPATNISQFAQPNKHHGQQCVRSKVSSFARAWVQTIEKSHRDDQMVAAAA